MLLRGLLKKVLLADRLGEMVDVVFEAPELYSGATIWLAVFAYAGQIYYDFSGYTDMAIGVAKMLGYRFPTNFRHPYLATSVAEFWKRWHMTLSRWLRDYLYIPLGGNRLGEGRTQVNLLLTMVLGGLWHGAAWTFLFWGLWHGLALVAHRFLARRFPSQHRFGLLSKTAGMLTTWFVVSVGWVFFRAEGFSDAVTVIGRMLGNTPGIQWYPPLVIGVLACMLLEHVAWSTPLRSAMRMRHDRWYSPVGTTIAIWCLLLYAPRGFAPFQYFQF